MRGEENRFARISPGASMKTKSKRKPHIAALDPDPAILNYLHRILADRFSMSLFTEAEELIRQPEGVARARPAADGLAHWRRLHRGERARLAGRAARLPVRRCPIILLACSAELKEVVAATRMGATDVVLKPFRKSRHRPGRAAVPQGERRHQPKRMTRARKSPWMRTPRLSAPASA